jgi:hypothetical protein
MTDSLRVLAVGAVRCWTTQDNTSTLIVDGRALDVKFRWGGAAGWDQRFVGSHGLGNAPWGVSLQSRAEMIGLYSSARRRISPGQNLILVLSFSERNTITLDGSGVPGWRPWIAKGAHLGVPVRSWRIFLKLLRATETVIGVHSS